ncbi:MAG TPA: cobalamin biosynthesis protein [Solirubrobacteraceae bacterium]|nr:cobalamin biosynthesis protein [Solirubrobacteraceae bacterium]
MEEPIYAVLAGRPAPSPGVGLAGGYLADLVFGDPRRLHPVAGFGLLAHRAEHALYRPTRARGIAHTALLVGSAAATAGLTPRTADWLAARLPAVRRPAVRRPTGRGPAGHPAVRRPAGRLPAGPRPRRIGLARPIVLSMITWIALGGRSLATVAGRLADQLEAGELDAARATLPSLCGRDPHALDSAELARAGLESVAENTSDAVVGALLWAAVAGPAGVAAYRAANTLDAIVGHRTDRYRDFGWAAARLDDLLNWPAARLSAILTAVCAPLVGGSPRTTWATAGRDGPSHPSPNAGRVEAAFAGALGVRLGGRLTYAGVVELRPQLGRGHAPTVADLRRAIRLSRAVGAAAAVFCAAARPLVRAGLPTLRPATTTAAR